MLDVFVQVASEGKPLSPVLRGCLFLVLNSCFVKFIFGEVFPTQPPFVSQTITLQAFSRPSTE